MRRVSSNFLAHLVERPTINQNVAGSSPAEISVTLASSFFHFLHGPLVLTG